MDKVVAKNAKIGDIRIANGKESQWSSPEPWFLVGVFAKFFGLKCIENMQMNLKNKVFSYLYS